jgi:hypothetical protein
VGEQGAPRKGGIQRRSRQGDGVDVVSLAAAGRAYPGCHPLSSSGVSIYRGGAQHESVRGGAQHGAGILGRGCDPASCEPCAISTYTGELTSRKCRKTVFLRLPGTPTGVLGVGRVRGGWFRCIFVAICDLQQPPRPPPRPPGAGTPSPFCPPPLQLEILGAVVRFGQPVLR